MQTIIETVDVGSQATPYFLQPGDSFVGISNFAFGDVDQAVVFLDQGTTYRFRLFGSSDFPVTIFNLRLLGAGDVPLSVGDLTSAGSIITFTAPSTGAFVLRADTNAGPIPGAAYTIETSIVIDAPEPEPEPEPVGPTTGNDSLTGTALKDVIDLLAGNDWFDAGAGADIVVAGEGNDTVFGGADKDSLDGGNGNDVLWTGSGNDTAIGGAGNDFLDGADGNDSLDAGNGLDTVSGGGGRDVILGGGGKDSLDGGTGNDTVNGGTGEDIIIGGMGNDVLIGGSGSDIFEFATASGTDRISDFRQGFDRIDLSGWGYDDFSDVNLATAGTGVRITFTPWDSLLIDRATVADFDSSDFIFDSFIAVA